MELPPYDEEDPRRVQVSSLGIKFSRKCCVVSIPITQNGGKYSSETSCYLKSNGVIYRNNSRFDIQYNEKLTFCQ
jgi:hypothetical protein